MKNNDDSVVDANPNIFVNSKDSPTTVASCGQVITRDVILLKDIECPGVDDCRHRWNNYKPQ